MKMIIIRNATIEDASLIAKTVGMAIGEDVIFYCGKNWIDVLTEVAQLEQSQYSFRNALIAEVDGEVAGAIIGYNGGNLELLRCATLNIISRYVDKIRITEDETEAGEFYIDTVAVLPTFRGQGIGHRLLDAICEKAFVEGYDKVGLIVDFENQEAERLYMSLGFCRIKTRTFLGHKMWHLQKKR